MHIVLIVSELAATISGIIAAALWWMSARIGWKPIPDLDRYEPKQDGAVAVQVDGGPLMMLDMPKQGRFSAYAAIWSGVSVLLQAIAAFVQIMPANLST